MERTYSFNDIVDQLLGLVDFVLAICHDETVQILLLIACMSGIRATLALFDGAFSTDCDLCAGVLLHGLERVTTRTDQ